MKSVVRIDLRTAGSTSPAAEVRRGTMPEPRADLVCRVRMCECANVRGGAGVRASERAK